MSRLHLAAIAGLFSLSPAVVLAQPEAPEDAAAAEDDTEAVTGEDGEPLPGQPPPTEKRPHIEEPEDEDGPEPPLIVPAPDQLSGHFSLSASALLPLPFSNLEANTPQKDRLGAGYGFGLDAAYGLTRTVAIGAWGQLLSFGDTTDCRTCKTSSTAFGAFVRYHLVQGMRFDPWMSAGLGYRITKITASGIPDTTYSGIEWLRLQVGGDWYPIDNLGLGPIMELDMGRYGTRSPGSIGDQANHWQLIFGARVTLDLPGKK